MALNAIAERNKTFGEAMTELRARLGMATQGSASKGNDSIIKSFLQEAHDFVFGELEPPAQRKKTVIRLAANSGRYDWHNDIDDQPIDPGRVISVHVVSGDQIRAPLTQGITEQDRSFDTIREEPQKYDTLDGQLELWPIPGQPYDLVIEYIATLSRFDRANDRPAVPYRLVFLYALATAKAHYRQPDAQAAAAAFDKMLMKEKSRQRENREYFVAGFGRGGSRAPQVVRNATGSYSLRS